MSDGRDTVDFGYREVPTAEKARLVRGVFDRVAARYDLMNDAMSLGSHRLWKRFAIDQAAPRPGEQVLDLASGTGDLAALMARRLKGEGLLVASDINEAMLSRGRDRLINEGFSGLTSAVLADAEMLPFPEGSFDLVTIAFGLRNVTHKARALEAIHHVLKPGGRVMILEFSHPRLGPLNGLYDRYSFTWLPRLGRLLAGDAESYRYLAESIRKHPDQDTLKALMERAGLERVRYHNLSAGIVAVHLGYRL